VRRVFVVAVVSLSTGATFAWASAPANPSHRTGSHRRHHVARRRHAHTHHAHRTHSRTHTHGRSRPTTQKPATGTHRHRHPGHPVKGKGKNFGGTDPVLFGDQTIESSSDSAPAGSASAFPFNNRLTGGATSISVYVDAGNQASGLIAGLYSDKHGRPGSLLASSSLPLPSAGAWNTVSFNLTSVYAGRNYWIAVLGQGGTLYFRDGSSGSCISVKSNKSNLTSLPPSWSTGAQASRCPASAYVSGFVAAPWNTVLPSVTGQTVQGQTVSASTGSWGNYPSSYAYQWQHCASAGCVDIAGATSSSYALQASDVGDTADVVVTASGSGGSSSATSAQTTTIAADPASSAPTNSSLPTISGTPTQGKTLTASPGTWNYSPTSYAYQWRRCSTSSGCANISGATSSSYVLQSSDVGDTIDVVVTASNAGGSASVVSAPTVVVTSGSGLGSTMSVSSPFGTNNQPYYAPFTPSNNRVISTSDGIFMSYFTNWSGVDGGTSDTGDVIVARSTNGGVTWTTLIDVPNIQGRHAGGALAADSSGDVYALIESIGWGTSGGPDGRIYMFPKSANFANGGTDYLKLSQFATGANKFAITYDSYSNTLWASGQYFAAKVTTTCQNEIGSSGVAGCSSGTTDSSTVWQWNNWCCSSLNTDVQYPVLYVARESTDAHVIVWAWSESDESANGNNGQNFYDDRFIFSTDDGSTWHGTSGSTVCASGCTYAWPIDGSQNGPSFLINPSNESSSSSTSYDGPWLDNVWVQDGHFMFMYSRCARDICSPVEAPEYARFSYGGGNAAVVNRILAPTCLSTQTFCPSDGTAGGFFSGAGTNNAPIYYTIQQSSSSTNNRIVVIKSTDSGSSWQDQAQSAVGGWNYPYGVSGGPTLTADGHIAGVFADMTNGFNGSDNKTLAFFKTA